MLEPERARPSLGVVGNPDDLASVVERGGLRAAHRRVGARSVGKGHDATGPLAKEAVIAAVRVDIGPGHLTAVVDAEKQGV